jgi:hypothetical protein
VKPGLDIRSLNRAFELIFRFGSEHDLFDASATSLDDLPRGALEVVAEQIHLALEHPSPPTDAGPASGRAAEPAAELRWHDVTYYHPCIHVTRDLSYHAFPLHCGEGRIAVRLVCIDSAGQRYPAHRLDANLPFRAESVERRVVRSMTPLRRIPEELSSEEGRERWLDLLREGFPEGLPFRAVAHERRLRVWCLMTYLFPLLERTPFLRVRVPDIRSARNVEALLQRTCLSALGVHRADHSSRIAPHRAAMAGTVIFGPEVRTGRLPPRALNCLEDRPSTAQREPPVAFIEVYGATSRPRVPEEWVVDVELVAPVAPVRLEDAWPFYGCALALSRGSGLVREALDHDGGVVAWLHDFLFGSSPAVTIGEERAPQPSRGSSSADPAAAAARDGTSSADAPEPAYVLERTELGRKVEGVWARCLAEEPAEPEEPEDLADQPAPASATPPKAVTRNKAARRCCNLSCLHLRLLEAFPADAELKATLGKPGHAATLRLRKLMMEQGIVTFTVQHMLRCLSPVESERWRRTKHRGVEVPLYRLPGEGPGE